MSDVISCGDDWYNWPPELWGTRDRAKARRRHETNQPLHPDIVIAPTLTLSGFGGLHDKPQRGNRSRDADRSREADRVLKSWGIR